MKRLANLKSSSNESSISNKRPNLPIPSKGKKNSIAKNNPYPVSGHVNGQHRQPSNGHFSFSTPISSQSIRFASPSPSKQSLPLSHDGNGHPVTSAKSTAPTLSTTGETTRSETAPSKAGTSATAARTEGEANSTFSSPAPSLRSLTTTLTTMQSQAPPNQVHSGNGQSGANMQASGQQQFSHQFPPSTPASAVPAHLVPHGHPTTYNTATANNILTDDASVLTLASSSKRRRRNSLDTNASVRALAPASMFGGSRESLPLSLLSANIGEPPNSSITNAPGAVSRPSMSGLASAERASVYSSSGIVPALTSERNSLYAVKPAGGDGGSVRNGLTGHGRTDSMTNSIAGVSSPLISPSATGRASRRGSAWGEVTGEESDTEKTEHDRGELEPNGKESALFSE